MVRSFPVFPQIRRPVVLALLAVFSVAACTKEVGSRFEFAKVDQLKPGVTTYAEAVAELGKPTLVQKRADGRTIAVWQYIRGTISGGTARGVSIVFGAGGVMERVASRTEIEKP